MGLRAPTMARLPGLFLAGALLLLPLRSAAAGDPPSSQPAAGADQAAMDSVRSLLRAGEKAKALEAARAVVKASPGDVEAHLLYQTAARGQIPLPALLAEYQGRATGPAGADAAFLLARLQSPAEGEKTLRDALKADSRSYWAQVGLATVLARQGKAAPAEAAALAALDLRPGDPRAAARAGAQCAEARRFAAAETCYRKALEGAPGDSGATRGLAHSLLRQGRVDDAAAALATLPVRDKPDLSRLLIEAAIASERRDLAAAEKALVQATTLAPGDTDAQVQLSIVRLRKFDAAAKAAGRTVSSAEVVPDVNALQKCALALPDRPDVRYALGFSREITGDVDGALNDYREATRLDPLDGDSIAALGAILVGKGLLDDAAREFTRALDRNPEDGLVLANLAYVYDQQGKTKEALDAYQKLVKLEPRNARAWHGHGLAMDAAGKAKESIASLLKAVDLAPNTARFLRDLGEAYFVNRRFDKAAEVLENAATLDPRDPTTWDALGRSYTQQRKYAEAVSAYEKVAELRPKDDDIQILIGAICQEFLKDYEKAKEHYNKYLANGGEAADVEDWIAECQAEIDRRKK